MKKVMITTAAMALVFGLSPFAEAQDNGSVPANDVTKTVNKRDDSVNHSYNDKTKTTWNGTADNSGLLGAAANNHSTAYTDTRVDLNNAFNTTKIVNTTKLDGYVSGNHIDDIGNHGGNAYSYSPGGYGGDGYAKVKAHSGDAYGGNGGRGGDARSGNGGYAYGGDGGNAKGGHGGYAEGGNGGYSYASRNGNGGNDNDNNGNGGANGDAKAEKGGDGGYAKGGDGGYAKGGDGGYAKGERSGDARGGNGGNGGYAESGYAAAQNQHSGNGGNGGRGGDAYGGSAGTFNASNTLSGLSGAAGVTVAIQNTGIAAMQQVGVTTMANVTVH